MNKKIIEAQRRKAAPRTGRAEAPRRETGGGDGFQRVYTQITAQ